MKAGWAARITTRSRIRGEKIRLNGALKVILYVAGPFCGCLLLVNLVIYVIDKSRLMVMSGLVLLFSLAGLTFYFSRSSN